MLAAALAAFVLVYSDWLLFAVRFFGSVRVRTWAWGEELRLEDRVGVVLA